ncbi:lysophospholipid acyltransferase family protein [Aestuariispira ectoiniformans]|uniref:lysophospholipid acyltransferase family protein n=1 Tax=Aestuariispira ectoiniformans TaxID=2775080 RepID=UPI00223B66A0|nr:lysophospholipid acyltransferase family protein [Aestuariispira ectoiniformans]
MAYIRSFLFGVSFYSLTTVLCFAYLPLLLLPRRGFAPFARFWVRCSLCFLRVFNGIDYRIRGQERLPDEPVIFASKHQSAWETLSLAVIMDDPAFVLKKELTWIPIFGWYLAKMQNVAVDRSAGAKALKQMVDQTKERLDEGRPVVIFPQGTRTAPGDKSKPYLPGVAALYGKANVPVVPVALNSGLFWPRRKFLKNPGTITLEYLEPIPPGLNRKVFLKELEGRTEQATDILVQEERKHLTAEA